MPSLRLISTVLDSPDPEALGKFYQRLLGGNLIVDDETFAKLRYDDGRAGLSFQFEPEYVAPTWPSRGDAQQISMHLDIQVDDVAAATEHALSSGARLHPHQPDPSDFTVFLDPDGHAFCLFEQ